MRLLRLLLLLLAVAAVTATAGCFFSLDGSLVNKQRDHRVDRVRADAGGDLAVSEAKVPSEAGTQ